GMCFGVQIGANARRPGTARAMTEYDNEPQAFAQVADRVIDASQTFDPQHIPGDTYDEEIVWRLVEDLLDGHAGIGAAEYKSKRRLSRRGPGQSRQTHR